MLSYKTVEPHTLELLKKLTQQTFLSKARLVGGTALALQYGHRMSIDLDFF
ncbi:nucleotidyl transferase AbiEii/AbiGii toxin family protein [uncultured Bacteroides sp.]|uniref:nucleotidyl transferase AbiEii/AbiGii toxin family protein n=1 Tax=uncultured Bacteroides sp. TaxID=162156 RepID=UPI00280A868A|nr:nucleotidyl transferase AbiEii/AbiGii toxin family protein [uncultured Bacteroides sp.]